MSSEDKECPTCRHDQLIYSYTDPGDGQYLEVSGHEHELVLRIYAPGKVSSTRAVEMPRDMAVALVLAMASWAYATYEARRL